MSWPSVRAAMLLVVIVTHGWVALPIGPAVTATTLQEPRAQGELDAWMKLFGPLGFTRDEFKAWVIDWSGWLVGLDNAVRAPIKPILRFTRTGQGWALFSAPDIDPQRLEIAGFDAEGQEHLLYRRLDPDAVFLRPQLDFRRVRGVYDLSGKSMPPRYRNWARWCAQLAFAAYPDIVRVEVRQIESHSHLPSEPPNPAWTYKYHLAFEREATP